MSLSGFLVERFETAESLLGVLARRNVRWLPYPADWVFRGQADAAWNLVPAVYRPGVRFKYHRGEYEFAASEWRQRFAEGELVRKFLTGIDQQGLPLPGEAAYRWRDTSGMTGDLGVASDQGMWPPPDLAPLFALAQHFGVPTRLLDWTERPFIAAYFAAVEAARAYLERRHGSGSLAVWCLNIPMAETVVHGSMRKVRGPFSQPELHFVRAPRFQNPNLRAQEGLFTVLVDRVTDKHAPGSSASPPLDLLLRERLQQRDAAGEQFPNLMLKLELPISESGRLLRLLADEWVSGATLYPGLEGVVTGLREQELWDTAGDWRSWPAGAGEHRG